MSIYRFISPVAKAFTVLALSAAAFSLSVSASAQSTDQTLAQTQSQISKDVVDDAKAKGLIGETVGGYLAVVDNSADRSVIDAMYDINIRRKSLYTKKAREQNVDVEEIAALTGEKVVENASSGEMVMYSDGQWVTK